MKNKFHETFINTQLDQHMSIIYDGFNYNAHRVDPDGYKTKLVLNKGERDRFIDKLLSHGWEKNDGFHGV